MDKEIILKVENLEQFFKMGRKQLKAVNDVSFDVYKGEVFGIVGESGCGKTTTGRSIIRLYRITGGNIYFKGKCIGAGYRKFKQNIKTATEVYNDKRAAAKVEYKAKINAGSDKESATAEFNQKIAEYKGELTECVKCNNQFIKQAKRNQAQGGSREIMNKMQMIFQDPIASLNPRMTVGEIIAEGLIIRGIKDKQFINQRVNQMLEMVGLVSEHANRYPHEFSGGQRQRIGIARAVILEPELIIADEPISALDVSIQAQVINLLNDLRKKLNLTIIFIAHDLSVVKYFSDRIAVMYYGKIVEMATSEELFAHPMHPYTKSLLSAIPVPDPNYEKKRTRIIYNPNLEHEYQTDPPSMREVSAGHFLYCNQAEFEASLKQLVQK